MAIELARMRDIRRLGDPGFIFEIDESLFNHDCSRDRLDGTSIQDLTIFDKQGCILGLIERTNDGSIG